MPTVLIVSTTFPPFGNVGAVRLGSFAKYLNRLGWTPVLVTLRHDHKRDDLSNVVNLPELPVYYFDDRRSRTFFHKALHKISRKLNLGFITYGWYPPASLRDARRAIEEAFRNHEIDIVIGSFVKCSAIRLASWAGTRFQVPWVADFRDTIDLFNFGINKRLVYSLEKKLVASASCFVTTTHHLKQFLESRYPQPVEVVENGIDIEDYQELTPARFHKFTLLYTGSLLPGRDPLPLYFAVDGLIGDGSIPESEIQGLHYGAKNFEINDRYLARMLAPVTNKQVLKFSGRVKRSQSLEAQLGAHLLFQVAGLVGNTGGNIPAKLFEYLAARRPILSISNTSQREIAEILSQCRAGIATDDVQQIREFVLQQYRKWKQTGTTALSTKFECPARFSREDQVRRLHELLLQTLADAGKSVASTAEHATV